VFAKYSAFLPFSLVVKVGRKFLGKHCLSLMEMHRGQRKIYCWTVYRDHDGRAVRTPFKMPSEKCVFEGFEYHYMLAPAGK
jgi:hypothetical protein